MVWFSCEDCNDSFKKPKLQTHLGQCSASRLTCLDCNATFDRAGAQAHTRCVTEVEKYVLGVTKGVAQAQPRGGGHAQAAGVPAGTEFLATRPPWRCSICNVTCTSRETLAGHAGGAKHVRRARAAAAAAPSAAAAGQAQLAQGPAASGAAAVAGAAQEAGSGKREPDGPAQDGRQRKKRKGDEGEAVDTDGAPQLQRVKWKKLAAKELRGGGLPLAKLQKRVLRVAGVPAGSAAAQAAFLRRVTKSSQFAVADGVVSLA